MFRLYIQLTLVFCLLASCPAHAGMVIGSGASASPCPSGSYLFAWNGDYTAATAKACFASGASTKDGAQTGGAIGATGQTGNGFRKTANNQYVSWLVAGGDGINVDLGTVWLSVYITDDGTDTAVVVFESWGNSTNMINLSVAANRQTSGAIKGDSGGATAQNVASGATNLVPEGAWTRIAYSWDRANSRHAVKIGAGDWVEQSEAWNTWGVAADDVTIGENASGGGENDTTDIDNVYVLGTYQAADPL